MDPIYVLAFNASSLFSCGMLKNIAVSVCNFKPVWNASVAKATFEFSIRYRVPTCDLYRSLTTRETRPFVFRISEGALFESIIRSLFLIL